MDPIRGRLVHFHAKSDSDRMSLPGAVDGPLIAVVVRVVSPTMVNLTVQDRYGHIHGRSSVRLGAGGTPNGVSYCELPERPEGSSDHWLVELARAQFAASAI